MLAEAETTGTDGTAMADDGMVSGPAPYGRVNVAELEHERLTTYVLWGEVEAPWWYWPAYGGVIATWVMSYHFGMLVGSLGAVLFAAAMGTLSWVVTSRSGVSMPRFRGMPPRLRRTFVPMLVAGLLSVVALGFALFDLEEPSVLFLGPVIGVAMAFAGWINVRWYRRESRRLAAKHGIER
jgi:hypothetical protein